MNRHEPGLTKDDENPLCHPELVSGSHRKEILKQVQNDRWGYFQVKDRSLVRTESRVAVMSIFLGMLLVTGCALKGEEELLVTVSPGSAVVTLGDTKQFSVDPAGTTVTWSVKDILGGTEGTVVGAIDTHQLMLQWLRKR